MFRLQKLRFSAVVFLFFFGSIIGFILEGLWCILKRGHWENHSATVFGPFCVIYGFGMVAFYLLSLFTNRKNLFIQLILSGLVGSGLEYIASLFQEKLFGSTSWDYSGHAFNLGGRISLKMTVVWGLLGVAFVRFVFPLIERLMPLSEYKAVNVLGIIMAVFMAINLLVSSAAVSRWQSRTFGVEPKNRIEKRIDKVYCDEKMKKLYPNMVFKTSEEE